jgi:hypothetical protein
MQPDVKRVIGPFDVASFSDVGAPLHTLTVDEYQRSTLGPQFRDWFARLFDQMVPGRPFRDPQANAILNGRLYPPYVELVVDAANPQLERGTFIPRAVSLHDGVVQICRGIVEREVRAYKAALPLPTTIAVTEAVLREQHLQEQTGVRRRFDDETCHMAGFVDAVATVRTQLDTDMASYLRDCIARLKAKKEERLADLLRAVECGDPGVIAVGMTSELAGHQFAMSLTECFGRVAPATCTNLTTRVNGLKETVAATQQRYDHWAKEEIGTLAWIGNMCDGNSCRGQAEAQLGAQRASKAAENATLTNQKVLLENATETLLMCTNCLASQNNTLLHAAAWWATATVTVQDELCERRCNVLSALVAAGVPTDAANSVGVTAASILKAAPAPVAARLQSSLRCAAVP